MKDSILVTFKSSSDVRIFKNHLPNIDNKKFSFDDFIPIQVRNKYKVVSSIANEYRKKVMTLKYG